MLQNQHKIQSPIRYINKKKLQLEFSVKNILKNYMNCKKKSLYRLLNTYKQYISISKSEQHFINVLVKVNSTSLSPIRIIQCFKSRRQKEKEKKCRKKRRRRRKKKQSRLKKVREGEASGRCEFRFWAQVFILLKQC